ncbi:MAG TPA: metallopeptidase family protein [Actinomycetota bacterium]|jgi:predicted Zn-dependent protease with MMP-like domain|nr:metallopeptidase family protein [Actinomycetota bacterium]
MDRDERFDELVAEALDGLPEWVQMRLSNVAVLVEERAPAGQRGLLGLYEGIAQIDRGDWYSGALPDRITLFRDAIERESRGDPERLRRVVAHTVAHEIAHHFGISDDRLRELGVY